MTPRPQVAFAVFHEAEARGIGIFRLAIEAAEIILALLPDEHTATHGAHPQIVRPV